MSVARTVAAILREHPVLEVESIDRLYLNVYVPRLQCDKGVVAFFRYHRGRLFASSREMEPMSTQFGRGLEQYAQAHGIPLLTFRKGQRKDEVLAEHLAHFGGTEGVLFLGTTQAFIEEALAA